MVVCMVVGVCMHGGMYGGRGMYVWWYVCMVVGVCMHGGMYGGRGMHDGMYVWW